MLRPRQAPNLLTLRAGVRRSGLGPWSHQAGRWGGVLKQGGEHFQPAAVPPTINGDLHGERRIWLAVLHVDRSAEVAPEVGADAGAGEKGGWVRGRTWVWEEGGWLQYEGGKRGGGKAGARVSVESSPSGYCAAPTITGESGGLPTPVMRHESGCGAPPSTSPRRRKPEPWIDSRTCASTGC